MDIRNQRQEEFANKWLESDRFNILYLCPRFGKIRTSTLILNKYPDNARILIAYPDVKIKKSWEEDLIKWGYSNTNITYTTHLSLKNHADEVYDLIILDETHLLSEAQKEVCQQLFDNNNHVLGLTGTLSRWTEKELREDLGLKVLVRYPIEKAIEEGILPDYEISVIKVPLDNKIRINYKGRWKTEKQRFDNLMWVVRKQEIEGSPSFFMKLKVIDLLMNSVSRKNKTKEIIQKHSDERLLVFCGRTEIADSLGIPSYHSKKNEKGIFQNFVEGKISHLAVVKIGNAGVTYTPLNRIILNHFDSNAEKMAQRINRAMSYEYSNPDKKAKIIIISSDENIELKWLTKSLEFFDKNKIKYL